MTRQQTIEHLSELPQDLLERWRLTLSNTHIAISTFESGVMTRTSLEQMADLISDALAAKQLNYYKGFDIQDTEYSFV